MKNIFSITAALAVAVLTFTGCYDDKGGNDFDTPMSDVVINIPESAYSASLGEKITITPEIKTNIDEKDLTYHWEVLGPSIFNDQGRNYFTPLVNDDEQAKVLNYTCHLDSAVAALNNSYKCRLRVHQTSTGRDFYSSNTFTINIAGITGLLVLHGDDNTSDVGVLEADEFTPKSNSFPDKPKASSALYSSNNNGDRIEGKGKSILQALQPDYAWDNPNSVKLYRVLAMTDKTQTWMNSDDFTHYGDWNSQFYLKGDRALNANKPLGFMVSEDVWIAFDGGDVFMTMPNTQSVFLFPEYTSKTVCADGNTFAFEPFLDHTGGSLVQALAYTSKVNGKPQKGFVAINNFSVGLMVPYTSLLDTQDDDAKFNPADMKADLITMHADGRKHELAILKGDADNIYYPGKFFVIDLNTDAKPSGESGIKDLPQYMHDMSPLTDIANARFFDFGSTMTMCYYATNNAVYQYVLDGATLYPSEKLRMSDGSALNISGEITMMKFLRSENADTHYSDPLLLVATYNGSSSAIYALHMDIATGKVLRAVKYDSSNVQGWNFGKIYDVNIKAL